MTESKGQGGGKDSSSIAPSGLAEALLMRRPSGLASAVAGNSSFAPLTEAIVSKKIHYCLCTTAPAHIPILKRTWISALDCAPCVLRGPRSDDTGCLIEPNSEYGRQRRQVDYRDNHKFMEVVHFDALN